MARKKGLSADNVIDPQPIMWLKKSSEKLRNFERFEPFNPSENLPEFGMPRSCPVVLTVSIETEALLLKTDPRSILDLVWVDGPM